MSFISFKNHDPFLNNSIMYTTPFIPVVATVMAPVHVIYCAIKAIQHLALCCFAKKDDSGWHKNQSIDFAGKAICYLANGLTLGIPAFLTVAFLTVSIGRGLAHR